MATDQPSNTPSSSQSTELSGLARRLHARAESVLLRDQPEQQSDLRQAARHIEELIRLRSEIAAQENTIKGEITKGVPEFVSITSVKSLLNRLLDHGRKGGDEALYADIETAGRLIFTLWDIIARSGIKDPAIELTSTDLFVDIRGDDGIALLRAGIQRAIDSTTDPVCRNHLRDLLGEG